MMARVKATYWAVIAADKRADNSPNWAMFGHSYFFPTTGNRIAIYQLDLVLWLLVAARAAKPSHY